jgi:anti-sigma factor RsiW
MIESMKVLSRSLAVLARETRSERDTRSHPVPEELVAYQAGDLSPDEDQEVQEHLILCPDCPDLLLALQDFSEPPQDSTSISDAGVAAAWRRFRKHLLGEARFDHLPRLLRRWLALPKPVLAFAGVCLLAALVAPWFLVATLGRAGPPRLLAAIELDVPTRGSEMQSIVIPAAQKDPIVLSARPEGPPHPKYEVVLLNTAGQRLQSKTWRPTSDSDLLVVQLPRSTPAGEYRLELRGLRDGKSVPEPADVRPFRLSFR